MAFMYGIDLMKKDSLQDKNTVINKVKHIGRQKTNRLIAAILMSICAICIVFLMIIEKNARSSLSFTIISICTLVTWLSYYKAVWSKRIFILIGQDDKAAANKPLESDTG